MNNLFECKVKYEKVDEQSGKNKKVTETYLLDAVSFTEAETRIYKEMETMIRGEFTIMAIKKANFSEIIEGEDIYYRGKLKFQSICEKSGKVKEVINNILVGAENIPEAYKAIDEAFKGFTADYKVSGLVDSNIMDFFKYSSEQPKIQTTEERCKLDETAVAGLLAEM